MQLTPPGAKAELDRYIGYWKPYATSHAKLDRDLDIQKEVANVAGTFRQAVLRIGQGRCRALVRTCPICG